MAKWPKDSPGTWYSHYKRGSLVSGPAGSPGWGLDFVCLMLCMVLVPPYKVCICIGTFLVGYSIVVLDSAWAALTIQSRNIGDALRRKWRRGWGTIQARFAIYSPSNGVWETTNCCLNSWLYVPPCHTSATLREHLLKVTACLDTPLTLEATTDPYIADLIVWTS